MQKESDKKIKPSKGTGHLSGLSGTDGDYYANRESYRSLVSGDGLRYFRVTVKETDLLIGASLPLAKTALLSTKAARHSTEATRPSGKESFSAADASRAPDGTALSPAKTSLTSAKVASAFDDAILSLEELAYRSVQEARAIIEHEIVLRPDFQSSFSPLLPRGGEPELIRTMLHAGQIAGTGPMAAVAGAVAAYVGTALQQHGIEVIVENGGDIFLAGQKPRTVAISAGQSPLSMQLGLKVDPSGDIGVCTSSGTYGHSLSFGKSDAAVVVAKDCALADAVATMLGNKCKAVEELGSAVEWAANLPGITGALVVMGEHLAAAGDLEFVRLG